LLGLSPSLPAPPPEPPGTPDLLCTPPTPPPLAVNVPNAESCPLCDGLGVESPLGAGPPSPTVTETEPPGVTGKPGL